MTIRQMRPEQKKLWRQIYAQEMERDGSSERACKEADAVVTHWEARGVFEEPVPCDALTSSEAWRLVGSTLKESHPDAFATIYAALASEERRALVAKQGSVDMAALAADMKRLSAASTLWSPPAGWFRRLWWRITRRPAEA